MTSLRAEIVREALAWLGTPYHHHGRVRGVGVDCAMLLAEVYAAAGAVPPIVPEHYPHDWHLHRADERFLAHLQRSGAHAVQTPAPGDVAVYRFGRAFSHGAVVVQADDLTVVHAYIGLGVVRTRATEAPLQGRPVQYWSLFA